MKADIQIAKIALTNFKNSVIGLAKIRQHFHLVTEVTESNFDCVYITEMGAMQCDYGISRNLGELKIFPEGKNMNEMMDDITEFSDFMKSFS